MSAEGLKSLAAREYAATVPGTVADETGTAGPGGDVVGGASARRPASAAEHAAADHETARSLRARPTALTQAASAVEAELETAPESEAEG